MKSKKTVISILTGSIILIACNNSTNISETSASIPQKNSISENFWKTTPSFNADSCYKYTLFQSQLGPRIPGSKAHEQCIQYLKKFFEFHQLSVELQKFPATTFDHKQWIGTNIIAKYNPNATNRILLCAHYDSRPMADRDIAENHSKPVPGSNDGASGVAVIMSITDALQHSPLKNIGIDIVLFDLEDYGNARGEANTWCLGSQYWAKNIPPTSIKPSQGILLDMVGDTNAVFPKEAISIQYNPILVHDIWNIAQKAGYTNYFIDQTINEITDDHLFINTYANIPTIDIIHYYPQKSDFFEHHHKLSDNMNNISKTTLKSVGQTLLYYLYKQEEQSLKNHP